MDTEPLQNKFAKLQRATVLLETWFPFGNRQAVDSLVECIHTLSSELAYIFYQQNKGNNMINSTTKPIADGDKTPRNNQGTIPNPKDGSSAPQLPGDVRNFKDSGSTQAPADASYGQAVSKNLSEGKTLKEAQEISENKG